MKKKIKPRPPLKPFGLDMSPDEALERFIGTKPDEVEANIDKTKKKKPPGRKKSPSGGKVESQSVVSLRDRRMAKRNTGR